MPIGPRELLIILLVVVLLFGAKKLPELARSMGRSMRILSLHLVDLRLWVSKVVVLEKSPLHSSDYAQQKGATQNRADSVGDGNSGCADGSWEEFGVHSGLCTVGKAKAQG